MHRLKHPFRQRAKHAASHASRHRAGSRRKVRQALLAAAALSFGLHPLVGRSEMSSTAGTSTAASRTPTESPAQRLARWQTDFDAFAAADKAHAPAPGGVLFVGSSSIRLWDSLETDFANLPVITKRGFGGSRLADCSDQVSRLVLPYRPSVVIVYAGDNDLAEGATPTEVAATFQRFVEQVRQALPETRIAYLSIKPSPSRAALIDRIRETNARIADYARGQDGLDYIDIYSKMLSADGALRPELFKPDMLHLNAEGYALWRDAINARLGPVWSARGGTATASAAVEPGAPVRLAGHAGSPASP